MIPMSVQLQAIAPAYARMDAKQLAGMFPKRKVSAPGAIGMMGLVGILDKSATVVARNQVNQLAHDGSVSEILVYVDSPGGSVAGVNDLYATIARAAEQKRVTAFIEDLGASGGYYAIAGATEIIVNATAVVGSIGTYLTVVDASRMLEKAGVDVIVIRAGKYKGSTEWGKALTGEEIDQLQKFVDSVNAHFLAAVARGRHMSAAKVADVADGRVFVGTQAVAAGLVDRVAMFEDVLGELVQRTAGQYWDLSGEAAVAKFTQLSKSEFSEHAARSKYPALAATVDGIKQDQRRQYETRQRCRVG